MINVLPLVGFKSLRALNAFHSLLLGLKMLPIYLDVDYVSFFDSFKLKTEAEKESALRQALAFVNLTNEELDALISFSTDSNGIRYTSINRENLKAEEIFEIVIAVCMEIGRIEITLVSEAEKKK